MAAINVSKKLAEALAEAASHLDYCGYGDKWERECAYSSKLPEKIEEALKLARDLKLIPNE